MRLVLFMDVKSPEEAIKDAADAVNLLFLE